MLDRPTFVTRKFPPVVGGMETLSAGVWRTIEAASNEPTLIANRWGNRHLAWWLPFAVLRLLVALVRRRVGCVITGDAVMHAAIGPMLRLANVPHATFVMGLDVTYQNRLYRHVVVRALRKAPMVIAISRATAEATVAVGVDEARVEILRLGVEVPGSPPDRHRAHDALADRLGLDGDPVILACLGRIVRRKGVRWFVDEVMPLLPNDVSLVVAGDGADQDALQASVDASEARSRIHLLGRVTDVAREDVMSGADVFIQPNIRVPGDMEGFGLVAIEAAVRGTPVVAAALEGLEDAIAHEETGLLVPPESPDAWVETLRPLILDPEVAARLGRRFRKSAIDRYGERAMAERLVQLLGPLASAQDG